jgi:hypothetical protein
LSDQDSYCIDTSSLLELKRFDRDVFPTLWENLEDMIASARLVAPIQVKVEIIGKGDDAIAKWVKRHDGMFRDIDAFQSQFIETMYTRFPHLANVAISRLQTLRADPFVIAVAAQHGSRVVTNEGTKQWGIPDICKRHDLEAFSLLDMMKRERWTF